MPKELTWDVSSDLLWGLIEIRGRAADSVSSKECDDASEVCYRPWLASWLAPQAMFISSWALIPESYAECSLGVVSKCVRLVEKKGSVP